MTSRAVQHFQKIYPKTAPLFASVKPIARLVPSQQPIAESVVRVVIGQMLSRAAARTIYSRVQEQARRQRLSGSWELNSSDLTASGLSKNKVRTICEFAEVYRHDPLRVESWRTLTAEEVRSQVVEFWGMSDWTAGILSIFYIGHEDVFPQNDGTLVRASELLRRSGYWSVRRDGPVGGERASPYRSYLALYLWKAIDEGALT